MTYRFILKISPLFVCTDIQEVPIVFANIQHAAIRKNEVLPLYAIQYS